jgi:hypothetical protein
MEAAATEGYDPEDVHDSQSQIQTQVAGSGIMFVIFCASQSSN